jgi:hypothetical protein
MPPRGRSRAARPAGSPKPPAGGGGGLPSPALLGLAEQVEASEPRAFAAVLRFLSGLYERSRKAQVVLLSPESSWRSTSRQLDGAGGAALLTELTLRVLARQQRGGAAPPARRELFKRLLLAAAWSLQMPVFLSPAGELSLGLRPAAQEPPTAQALRRLLDRLPLPPELLGHVLAFAGECWVGVVRQPALRLCRLASSCALEAGEPSRGLALRRLLPWAAARLSFCDEGAVLAEWDAERRLLWLAAPSLWPFITLLRCRRRRRGRPSGIMVIRGFGEVLV